MAKKFYKPKCKPGNKPCGLICISEKEVCRKEQIKAQKERINTYKKGRIPESDLSTALSADKNLGTKLPKETALIVAEDPSLTDLTKKKYFASASREWNIPLSMGSDPDVKLKNPDPVFSSELKARGIKHYGEEIPEDKTEKKSDIKEFITSHKWEIAALGIMAGAGIAITGTAIALDNKNNNNNNYEITNLQTADEINKANRQAARTMAEAGVMTPEKARAFQQENMVIPEKISAKEDYFMTLEKAKRLSEIAKEDVRYLSGRDRDQFVEIFGYEPEQQEEVADWYGNGQLSVLRGEAAEEFGNDLAKLDSYVLRKRTGIVPKVSSDGINTPPSESYINGNYYEGLDLDLEDQLQEIKNKLAFDKRQYDIDMAIGKTLLKMGPTKEEGQRRIEQAASILRGKSPIERDIITGKAIYDVEGNLLERREVTLQDYKSYLDTIKSDRAAYIDRDATFEDISYEMENRAERENYYDPANLTANSAVAKGEPIPPEAQALAERELRLTPEILDREGNVISSEQYKKDLEKAETSSKNRDQLNEVIKSTGDSILPKEQKSEQINLWKKIPNAIYTKSYHESRGRSPATFSMRFANWLEDQKQKLGITTPEEENFLYEMVSQGISKSSIAMDTLKEEFNDFGSLDKTTKLNLVKQTIDELDKKVSRGYAVLPFFKIEQVDNISTIDDTGRNRNIGDSALQVDTWDAYANTSYYDLDPQDYSEMGIKSIMNFAASEVINKIGAIDSPIIKFLSLDLNTQTKSIAAKVQLENGNICYAYVNQTGDKKHLIC